MAVGKQYLVEGRWVGINKKGVPIIEYKLEDAIRIPMSADFLAPSIPREVTLSGLGKVVKTEPMRTIGELTQPTAMMCTVRHNNWEQGKPDCNSFDVSYIIRQTGDMVTSYSLIKAGAEISITGFLCGHGADGKSWLVEATRIAVKRKRKTGTKKCKNAKMLPSKLNRRPSERSRTQADQMPELEACCCRFNRGEGGSSGVGTTQALLAPNEECPEYLEEFSALDIKGKGKEKC